MAGELVGVKGGTVSRQPDPHRGSGWRETVWSGFWGGPVVRARAGGRRHGLRDAAAHGAHAAAGTSAVHRWIQSARGGGGRHTWRCEKREAQEAAGRVGRWRGA